MNYIHKYTTCIIQYLYIYIMISSAGMALPAYIGNDNFIILTLLMGIYYVLKKKTLFHLQKQYLLFIGCLFFSMLLVIIGSTLSLGTALSVTSIPLIIYTTYKIDPRNYLQRFVKLIFYIALISIILFTIIRLFGFNSFSGIFPHLYTSFYREGQVYSYGGFLYRFVTLHSDRNCGPFGEPGQYQCVLAVALYFTLFRPLLFSQKYTKCFKIATLICILFIIGIIGFFMGRNNVNIQIFIDTSMTVLPFFAIGYIFRKYTHILEPNKWDKYWILFVLMSGGITYLLSGGNLMYIENKFDVHPIAFYVSGITGTLCVLFISKAIVKIPFISYIGRYSIMLLVTHLLLLAVVSLIINKIISNHDRAYWCTVCITLASYSIIIPLMKRFLPFVTAQKDLFKV